MAAAEDMDLMDCCRRRWSGTFSSGLPCKLGLTIWLIYPLGWFESLCNLYVRDDVKLERDSCPCSVHDHSIRSTSGTRKLELHICTPVQIIGTLCLPPGVRFIEELTNISAMSGGR